MYKWYLPTLSEVLGLGDRSSSSLSQGSATESPAQQRIRAEREWAGAVAALNRLLQQVVQTDQPVTLDAQGSSMAQQGVVFSGPFPVLTATELAEPIQPWTFTIADSGSVLQVLPAVGETARAYRTVPTLPLLSQDPLAAEQFCVVLTMEFSLAMALGETAGGQSVFQFSFDPDVVWQSWRLLQARIKLAAPQLLDNPDRLVQQFPPVPPDYRLVTQFMRLVLAHLPQSLDLDLKRGTEDSNGSGRDTVIFRAAGQSLVNPLSSRSPIESTSPAAEPTMPATSRAATPRSAAKKVTPCSSNSAAQSTPAAGAFRGTSSPSSSSSHLPPSSGNGASRAAAVSDSAPESSVDTELLKAIAHEVRTPLTTIRTLTRLLLKRKELNPDVIKRLQVIDRECTEQIDRFSLIFRAVELETTDTKSLLASLAPISLDQVLQQNVPRWRQQAHQHNHTLDVVLPHKLPLVMTDPTMLDQALTGLIDRITHSLPPGSHIQVRVSLAGHQLKLQLESQPQAASGDGKSGFGFTPALKSIGQLLMFQPETGNLTLNMTVTKNLFQALGGKLIVRQRPQQGEVLTIFLPLEASTRH